MTEKNEKKADLENYEPSAYTEIGEYKGNPMISIHGGMRPFGFGFRKAELILEVIDDIKVFVEDQRKKRSENPASKPPSKPQKQ